MVNFSLEGKVAWVTGASYGIGFALSTAFSEAGAETGAAVPERAAFPTGSLMKKAARRGRTVL